MDNNEEKEIIEENNISSKKDNSNIIKTVAIFVFGALVMYGAIYTFPQQFSTTVTKTETDVTVTDTGLGDSVEKVYDSVVVVSTYKDNTLYSTGTGFVYETEGDDAFILTNAHVIDGGNKVTVTLTNGKIIETEVVGSNANDDVAVLKMDATEVLQVAELGSTDDMRVGDTTFAIGAPLDSIFSWTVTRGIVSGQDRLIEVDSETESGITYIMNVMQTDAAINSGNSGGPLCNVNGEVIGITTLKLKEEGVEGMGFAIPIEEALEAAEDIQNGVIPLQPYLGVSMIEFAAVYYDNTYASFKDDVEASKLDAGVIIVEVVDGSPADLAGFKPGDIIAKIEDKDTKSISYFKYELYEFNVGEKVTISFYREGKLMTTEVTLKSTNEIS